MEHVVFTQLSATELSSMIEEAVGKALGLLPQQQQSRKTPITRRELMSRLNVSEPTLIRWEKKGVIPVMHIGSHKRYDWDAVLKALESKGRKY